MFIASFILRKLCACCHERRTRQKDGEGKPICKLCALLSEKRKVPSRLFCPIDSEPLQWEIWPGKEESVAQRCPVCRGLWMDYDEVTALSREPRGTASSRWVRVRGNW